MTTKQKRGTKAAPTAAGKSRAGTKSGDAKTALPLTWSAVEYVPRKRWWFFLTLGWFALPIALILVAFGNWSAALVVMAIAAAYFVLYLPKPKFWNYKLTTEILTAVREPRRGSSDEIRLELADFQAFATEVMRTPAKRGDVMHFVLVRQKRLGFPQDIYLPDDFERRMAIAELMEEVLPFDDEDEYLRTVRVIDRVARWLKLS